MSYNFIILGLLFILVCLLSNTKSKKINNKLKKNNNKNDEIISKIKMKIKFLIENLKKLYPKHKGIQRLPYKIYLYEIPERHKTKTAYVLNKKEIYICIDENKDLNELYFIVLHELAHIITDSVGHKNGFWVNFRLILRLSIKLNLYKFKNYKRNPKYYCNKLINNTPLI